MKIKVVGLDPALQNLGTVRVLVDATTLAVEIEDMRLIETQNEATKHVRKNSDDLRRARDLYGGMVLACTGRDIAIAEVPVGSQSARAMASYGVCVGLLAACPIPLIEVRPDEVKMVAVGDKQAAKEEMIEWAMTLHPNAPWITQRFKGKLRAVAKNEHLADALAAVYAGIQTQQFKQAVALAQRLAA